MFSASAAHGSVLPIQHWIRRLQMIVLMPHGGCNCRCIMCDIWKANCEHHELYEQDIIAHIDDLRSLGPKLVTLSGGEAMMSSNLWNLCRHLRKLRVTISLMSTGLLLKRNADHVVKWCDAVTVSL